MTRLRTTYRPALSPALAMITLFCAAGAITGQALAANAGTITLLNDFSQGYNQPGWLVEVSPGVFEGIAIAGAPGGRVFQLTSQGALTSIYTFPANAGPVQTLVQAVDGRIYGEQQTPQVNFSFTVAGNLRTYPQTLTYVPLLAISTPEGPLYGTEHALCGSYNAFVKVAQGGATTVLHNFTPQEGDPYVQAILASDGNFYGISAVSTCSPPGSDGAMVYRVTPQGDFKILASYPYGGGLDEAPGTYQESLLQATNGKLYGTAAFGGANRAGSIFEVSLDGTYKVLHQYSETRTGAPTFLTEASDGNLYGVTNGNAFGPALNTLYRITTAGSYERLQVLEAGAIGSCPCWLTQGSDGRFYGTSMNGGPVGLGTAWIWDLGLPKPLPGVRALVPASGPVGTAVTIWGKNLLGTTAVTFNGIPASNFRNISSEYVSAAVPPGATSGPVVVTTPNGTATSPRSFSVE